jgi:hypothetical protein
MVWKFALAAGVAALIAPLTQFAPAAPSVEVSGAAWTGAVRSVAVPASGLADAAFVAAVQKAAAEVCTPANESLRNVDREAACVAEATASAFAAVRTPSG